MSFTNILYIMSYEQRKQKPEHSLSTKQQEKYLIAVVATTPGEVGVERAFRAISLATAIQMMN